MSVLDILLKTAPAFREAIARVVLVRQRADVACATSEFVRQVGPIAQQSGFRGAFDQIDQVLPYAHEVGKCGSGFGRAGCG